MKKLILLVLTILMLTVTSASGGYVKIDSNLFEPNITPFTQFSTYQVFGEDFYKTSGFAGEVEFSNIIIDGGFFSKIVGADWDSSFNVSSFIVSSRFNETLYIWDGEGTMKSGNWLEDFQTSRITLYKCNDDCCNTPVPIPGSFMLLFSGLTGFLISKKKINRL